MLSALPSTECVGVEVVDAEVKDRRSVICEAPAGVSERGCVYRAYTSFCGEKDMIDVTDTLKFPSECALCFPYGCCQRLTTGGDQLTSLGPFTKALVRASIFRKPATI